MLRRQLMSNNLTIEIILRNISNEEKGEIATEKRYIFSQSYKVDKLKKDPGLLGEILCQ